MRSTLDPTLDVVFKMLFGSPAGHDSLVALLNAVLRPAVPIKRVEVLNPDPGRDQVQEKGILLDLLLVLENGTRIDVEVQTYPDPTLRQRGLFYWSRLHVAQLGRGQAYGALRRTISILLLNFRELEGNRWHSTFRVREVHDGVEWSDELELHVIELPKRPLPAASEVPAEERDLLSWVRFLGAKSDEEIKEACMANPDVARANELLENLSASPSAQELARRRELALITYHLQMAASRSQGEAAGRAEGREEGRAVGRAEGREEGREEGWTRGMAGALSRLLARRFGALPEWAQHRVHTATSDELSRWIDQALDAPSLDALLRG